MTPGNILEAFRHWDEDGKGFAAWKPSMFRTTCTYQRAGKDPDAFSHNGMYMIQTLCDSVNDMGYDVACMIRAEIPLVIKPFKPRIAKKRTGHILVPGSF